MKQVQPWAMVDLIYFHCGYYTELRGPDGDDVGDAIDPDFLDFIVKAEGHEVEWCIVPLREGIRGLFMRVGLRQVPWTGQETRPIS